MAKEFWEDSKIADDGNFWEASKLADQEEPPVKPSAPAKQEPSEPMPMGTTEFPEPEAPKKSSVLENKSLQEPAPKTEVGLAPLDPKYKQSVEGVWDAANPAQRAIIQGQGGYVGKIARDHAAPFVESDQRQDKPETLQKVDPRAESRKARLVAAGEDPVFAERAAKESARAGANPGDEVKFIQNQYGTAGEDKSQIGRMVSEYDAAPQGEKPTGTEVVTNGVMRGIYQNAAIGQSLMAAGAKGVGADELSTFILQSYFHTLARAKGVPGQIEDFTHIKSMSDIPTYILEGVLENAPQLVGTVGTSTVGAILARKFGQKAVAGMVAEQAAKTLAKREAMGAATGSAVSAIGMETGSIYGDLAKDTKQERPGIALAFGTVAGALDAIPAFHAAKTILGNEPVTWAIKDVAKRYGKEALSLMGEEGFTEFLQTWIEKAATTYVDGRPWLTKENLVEAIDAGLKGASSGAAMGIGSKAIHDLKTKSEEQIKVLRSAGDTETADLLQKKLDKENLVQTVETELNKFQFPAAARPDFQTDYRNLRQSGKAPADAAARATSLSEFRELATQAGMNQKMIDAALTAAAKKTIDELPGFFHKYTNALAASQLVRPTDIAGPIEAAQHETINHVIDVIHNAPKEEAAPPSPESEQAVDNIAKILSTDGHHILDVPELGTVHQAATSPLNSTPEPTPAQKEAGNYKLGHMDVAGLDIKIENPQGSYREGTSQDGKAWKTPMQDHYGYFGKTEGADGDKVDVFIKPATAPDFNGSAFVVDQIDPKTGEFDEHKVVLGAKSQAEAEEIYHRNYDKGWKGMGAITEMPVSKLKDWLKNGNTKAPIGATVAPENQAATRPGQGIAPVAPTVAPVAPTAAPNQVPAPATKGTGDNAGAVQTAAQADTAGKHADSVEILGRDSVPLSEGGKPFKTKAAAQKEKKMHPTKRVKKTKDGFVLVEKSAAQIAAQEKAGQKLRAGNAGAGPISAHAFIALDGGLNKSEMSDAGFDKNVKVGNRWLFARTGGMTLADAAEKMAEAGYIQDESESEAARVIKLSLTSPQYTAEGWEMLAEAENKTRFEDHVNAQMEAPDAKPEDFTDSELEESGFNDATKEEQAEVLALIDMADSMGIDTESILEDVARRSENATQKVYYAAAKQALQSAINAQSKSAGDSVSTAGHESHADGQNQPADQAQPESPDNARTDNGQTNGQGPSEPAQGEVKKGLRVGFMPTDTVPVTVRNGVIFIGDERAGDHENDNPVTVPDGATDAEIVKALKDAGALSRRQKVFGLEKETPAAAAPAERPDALIELRKREAVLKALRKCMGA